VTTAIRLEEQATPGLASRPARRRRHVLSGYHDVAWGAVTLAGGGIVAQGFANFYVITTRPGPTGAGPSPLPRCPCLNDPSEMASAPPICGIGAPPPPSPAHC
jgi:hypothetical protein